MKQLLIPAVALALSVCGQAHADSIYCTGSVANVLLYGDGYLMITASYRGDYTTLCSVQQTRNGIDPTTCWGWYSVAMTAKKEAKSVTINYNDPSAVSCSTLPTYGAAPAPVYVMINQ